MVERQRAGDTPGSAFAGPLPFSLRFVIRCNEKAIFMPKIRYSAIITARKVIFLKRTVFIGDSKDGEPASALRNGSNAMRRME
jgi:hypothetical protein